MILDQIVTTILNAKMTPEQELEIKNLIDNNPDAKCYILDITCNEQSTLFDVSDLVQVINKYLAEDAKIVFNTNVDTNLSNETIILNMKLSDNENGEEEC